MVLLYSSGDMYNDRAPGGSSSEGVKTGSGGVEIFSVGASSAGVEGKKVLP